MSVKTTDLATFIDEAFQRRIALALRLKCLDKITLRVTRSELRTQFTHGDRIKNISISNMIRELKSEGYHVEGTPGGEEFLISFDTREYLTNPSTLCNILGGNEWLEEILSEEEV